MTAEPVRPVPLDVLLIEDSPSDALLIEREILGKWPAADIERVQTGDRVREALAGRRWDVILSDHEMPGFSATLALEICRTLAPETPFLVVSGKMSEEAAVAVMKGGACDYISKDRLSMLVPAIEREIREARFRQEHVQLEKQFLRAQRLESVGLMASGIAHDLNNIFLPITMVIGLLRSRLVDEEGRKYLALLESSTDKGTELTRQMLSFVRGEKGGGKHLSVESAALLHDIGKMIRMSFPKRITIVEKIPETLWPISGNPTQIQQVLLNLCINARDSMAGGGTLVLHGNNSVLDDGDAESISPGAKGGKYVVLSVVDTGSGIPDADREKIFDAFFSTKEPDGGTGLGLSTVLKIVTEHGGLVSMKSVLGKGSEFSVYFPAAECGSDVLGQLELQPPLKAGRDETILVVDDEMAILMLIAGALELNGYRVLRASNGAEALCVFEEHRDAITAVLLDFVMPVLDGPETMHAIRRLAPAMPIIYVSGSEEIILGERPEGVQGILAKPFTMDSLLQALKDAIGKAVR